MPDPDSKNFAVNLRRAAFGVRERFEDQDSGAFTEHEASSALRSNGRECQVGVALPFREKPEQVGTAKAERVDFRIGTPGNHDIRTTLAGECGTPHRSRALPRHRQRRDRVRRALAIGQNRDVAGQHVRKILEQPDRLDLLDAVVTPDPVIELVVACSIRLLDRAGKFLKFGGNDPGAQIQTDSGRIHTTIRERPGILKCHLSHAHGKLDIARHVFQAFGQRFLEPRDDVISRIEIKDLADSRRDFARYRKTDDRSDATPSFAQGESSIPLVPWPIGLLTPRPVTTTREADGFIPEPLCPFAASEVRASVVRHP
jgi:hypothetical protein